MAIQPWDFDTLVENQAAAIQAKAAQPIPLGEGTTIRAWIEAQAGVGLYLQGLVVKAIALSLFATRYGQDADDFGAQFGFRRLQAVPSSGAVTLARYTDSEQGIAAVGSLVATGDGSVQFAVTADPTNANWSAAAGPNGGYVAAVNTASIEVPIAAVVAGAGGNVIAGAITQIQSQLTGFDTVTNAAGFTNGLEAETDPVYKARFPIFLAGLASADAAAIVSATRGVQQGIIYIPIENFDYPGVTEDDGSFFVIVDDGSHNPPQTLLTAVYDAVYPVRGFTIRFQGVYGPTATPVSLSGTISVAPGFQAGAVIEAVEAAWGNWINGLYAAWAAPIMAAFLAGDPVTLSPPLVAVAEAAAVAMNVPGVANITLSSILINGSNADQALTLVEAPEPGTINVASA